MNIIDIIHSFSHSTFIHYAYSMLIKTRGIVLRSIKYAETSLICDVYTEELGLRTYIISGVRKPKAKVSAGLLQMMTLLDLVVYHRKDKELNRTKEIKPNYLYRSIPFDAPKRAVGTFMTELLRKTIREAEANPDLFNFLYHSFLHLDDTPHSVANIHLYFMVQLSHFLGFMPGGTYSEHTPFFDLREGIFTSNKPEPLYCMDDSCAQMLHQFITTPITRIHELQLPNTLRQTLLDKLILFYRYHIDNMPELNAHLVLREVL